MNGQHLDLFESIVWGYMVSGPSGPQVYEDDLDRNYYLMLGVLIALRPSLEHGDGLPTVKDLHARFSLLINLALKPQSELFNQPFGLQAAYLLATLLHNWHKPLYTRRGGKRAIKDSLVQQRPNLLKPLLLALCCRTGGLTKGRRFVQCSGTCMLWPRKLMVQGEGIRWECFILVKTSKMSNAISRNQRVQVLKTLYLKLIGKKEAHCIPTT